jgi:hypothetical protein
MCAWRVRLLAIVSSFAIGCGGSASYNSPSVGPTAPSQATSTGPASPMIISIPSGAATLGANALCRNGKPGWHVAERQSERGERDHRRDVEECRERSLRVARGQSNVADRWHASHIAIVWRRSEATSHQRAFAFCSAVTRAPTPSGRRGRQSIESRKGKDRARQDSSPFASRGDARRDVPEDSRGAATSEGGRAPGRTRTCDPRFRSPRRYPSELRAAATLVPLRFVSGAHFISGRVLNLPVRQPGLVG